MSTEALSPGPLVTALNRATVPARMRTAMLRRSLREHPGPAVAGLAGLVAAIWLIRYGLTGDQHTLSILAGSWVLGWIVLPLLLGGGRGRVRPTHLRLEPVGPVTAAVGLLAGSAVGIGPAVSLLALASLPAHAAQYGPGPTLVSAVGALLLWLIGLIGSAVALEAVGHAGGPIGAVLTGVFTGTVMGVLGSIWAVAPWATLLLVVGPPGEVVQYLGYVPSSWPVSAVTGPPDRGARMLAGLVLLVAIAFLAYLLLVRRVISTGLTFRRRVTSPEVTTSTATAGRAGAAAAPAGAGGTASAGSTGLVEGPDSAGSSGMDGSAGPVGGTRAAAHSSAISQASPLPQASPLAQPAPLAGIAPTARARSRFTVPAPTWAVTVRELRTWLRHPLRLQYLAFAVVYGALLAALPVLVDFDFLLPWAGPLAVLWGASMSAGMVGLDGTALWMPLTTPDGERAEVRGRALAWLILFTPIGLLLTTVGALAAPETNALLAFTALLALLGAGATVPVWVSLLRVRPVADTRHPTSADNPTDIISVLVAAGAGLVTAAPAFALQVWGPEVLRWPSLLLGLLCGVAVWYGGIWLADDRLGRHGAEVLTAAGQRTKPPTEAIPLTWDADWYRENKATAWALLLLTVGWIPVIPQGLMVLAFGIDGGWIVASHLTGGTRTGVALGMVALGGAMLLAGLVLWGRRSPTSPVTSGDRATISKAPD
jgi:ABC-2 type transport system permease protein